MHRLGVFFLVLLGVASPLFGQTSSRGVVNVAAEGPTAAVKQGSRAEAAVLLNIRPGFHINAEKPSEDYLIGTRLSLTPPDGVKVGRVIYPAAKKQKFSFSEEPMDVYDGQVRISATLEIGAAVPAGKITVPGSVRFQACNDEQCYPPATVDVSFDIDVIATEPERQSVSISGAPPEARVVLDGELKGRADSTGRVTIKDVEPGRHRLRVELEGYAHWEDTVTVEQKKALAVSVALMREATPQVVTEGAIPAQAQSVGPVSPTPPAVTPSAESRSALPYVLTGVLAAGLVAGAVLLLARRRVRG
jgi:hypothetical protein